MSNFNPWTLLFEQRAVLIAFGGLAGVFAVARSAPAGVGQASLAVLLLLAIPAVALALGGRAGRLFVLVGAAGAWSWLRPGEANGFAVPVLVLNRLSYFAVPPLVLDLALGERGWERLKLEPFHVYLPTLITGLGVIIHLMARWEAGLESAESEIRWAAVVYAGCYLVLLVVALLVRSTPAESKLKPAPVHKAVELEESGRFGLASRVYERDGQVEKGAQTAERAGEWQRAAFLYRRVGDDFHAAEMYYRALLFEDALECYERAGALAPAARLCAQLGRTERAVALYEQAGDRAAAVAVLEEAGVEPTAEQFRRAGMLERAVQMYEKIGEWQRAAEICEHELRDLARAASLYMRGGSFLQAGRILESLGRTQEALEAFAAVPAGAVDAARLYLARGATQQAAELLARLPAAELDTMEDEATLVLVARVMIETDRVDEAVRIAQGLKRRGSTSGPLCLLLGRAFLRKGLRDLAVEELRIATSLPLDPPDETLAAYLLGCALEEEQQVEEAVRIFHAILQKDLGYADVQERYRRLKAASPGRVEMR